MKKHIFAIFDTDSAYAEAFACCARNYLETNALSMNFSYDIQIFCNPQALYSYVKENTVSILFYALEDDNTIAPDELTTNCNIENILYLTEIYSSDDMHILKYSMPDRIFKLAFSSFELSDTNSISSIDYPKPNITGIFSPVNRCGKTMFSLCLASAISENSKTLFISLDENSVLKSFMPYYGYCDLADLLYYHLKQSPSFASKLNAGTCNFVNLDYLSPIRWDEDIFELKSGDFASFLSKVSQIGGYTEIIIDFGMSLRHIDDYLLFCSSIYMPLPQDTFSQIKKQMFFNHIQHISPELSSHIECIAPPHFDIDADNVNFAEHLFNSSMMVFAKSLLNTKRGEAWHN